MKCTLQATFRSLLKYMQYLTLLKLTINTKTLKGTHACDQKTRLDIVTMNAVLLDIFPENLPKAICKTYKPICMKDPNTVFLHV